MSVSRRVVVASLAAVAALGTAWACGPNFPWQLFDDRDQAMAEPMGLGFDSHAVRLVPARHPSLKTVEGGKEYERDREPEAVSMERSEVFGVDWRRIVGVDVPSHDAFLAKLDAARRAPDGKAALLAGAGLPDAVLQYVAGAVEFHTGRMDEALGYFSAIDASPPMERRLRIVAATYMKGRIYQQKGDADAARAAFQATRLAARGAPDPMGLGIASLGEEARVNLIAAGLAGENWPIPREKDPAKAAKLAVEAVRLYAEQAAQELKSGLLSLREVASTLMAREELLPHVVADEVTRRLLVAYAVARDGEGGSSGVLVDADPALAASAAGRRSRSARGRGLSRGAL